MHPGSWPPAGSRLGMSDLFGQAGTQLLDHLQLPTTFAARGNSLRRLLDPLDAEIALVGGMVAARLARHPGDRAIQHIDGLGPVLALVLVAEIGEVTRFPGPRTAGQLGRVDSPPSRVRPPRAPRQDHQAGLPAAPAGQHRSGAAHRPADPAGRGPRTRRRAPRPQASAWSPRLASLSVWPTTGCATATSAAWQHQPHTHTVGAGRAGHDPHLRWRGRPV